MSILGGQQRQRSILGGYNPIRQIATPFGQPGQPAPMMGAMGQGGGGGQPPAYGSDEWALQGGGPGGLLWRQIVRGMSRADDPRAVLDPKQAAQFYTADTIGALRPEFQQAFAKKAK